MDWVPLSSSRRDTERGMSQENLETARRHFDAFNRAFSEGASDFYEMLDPNVELVPMSALLEGTRYHGHDAVREWFEEMKRDWTSFEVRPEQFRDLGDGRVLVLGSWRARGRGGEVLLTSRKRPGWSGTGREGPSGCRPSPTARKPSKPPGCRSRRCRRRTWRSCGMPSK